MGSKTGGGGTHTPPNFKFITLCKCLQGLSLTSSSSYGKLIISYARPLAVLKDCIWSVFLQALAWPLPESTAILRNQVNTGGRNNQCLLPPCSSLSDGESVHRAWKWSILVISISDLMKTLSAPVKRGKSKWQFGIWHSYCKSIILSIKKNKKMSLMILINSKLVKAGGNSSSYYHTCGWNRRLISQQLKSSEENRTIWPTFSSDGHQTDSS